MMAKTLLQSQSVSPPARRGRTAETSGGSAKGQMVPEFEKVAFENDAGKVIGPVKTQFGYHVIKVTGRK